ncbi:MAG: Trk family potassium uptake protein [Elusimicrobia bacterium]|nr:Trk family potassium uptake protein [Elusimicrobiota bacterium]
MIFSFGKRPAVALVLSFALTILTGTVLLMLPVSTPKTNPISFIDALFTATSATCVTGLIVRSTPHGFTVFGKTIILILVQLGGLGIMTFSVALILTLGKKISKSQEVILRDALNEENIRSARQLLKFLLYFTFGTEILGAIIIFFCFKPYFPAGAAAKYALFHSVSAFCNAGFSLFDTSLMKFSGNPTLITVFSALIILGGLGFVVLGDILSRIRNKTKKLKIHTKIVLLTTFILIILGTLLFYAAEKNSVLAGMNEKDKWFNSYFQSVTARTAGFNTVDIPKIRPASKFTLSILMFIGASPGGTGGGIKTITFFVIILLALSHIKNRESITIFRRSIPSFFARRAVTIFLYASALVAAAFAVILFFENFPFENLLFETVSAFGTVGLSTGITPHLSNASKFVIIILMFMGRLGPLTIALAAIGAGEKVPISYASERIMLG